MVGREGIRRASDKTVVEVHGGEAPSEEHPEEGVCEKTDCMKVGWGGHVGMEAEEGRLDARRDARLGRHSRSGHADSAKKGDHREATLRTCGRKLHRERNLRAGNVWKACLSMSSLHGDVYGIDEPRHGDLVRRLSGVMIAVGASGVVGVAGDVWSPDRMDVTHALREIGGGAGINREGAGAAGGNGGADERRKELRPRLSWTDSSRVGEVGKREKHTQRKQMYSPREREDPEQKRGRQRQERGMKSLDP